MTGVHQVLAKLAGGDAIGNEALGIQRLLRNAGYNSDIFVELADTRLEPLTRDYHELADVSREDNLLLHHFSLGSKASRTAYALPDRMALVYHNITPPEYFVNYYPALAGYCFWGRRELRAYASRCVLALGASEYNRLELDAAGFPRTDVLPVVADLSHLDVAPSALVQHMFDDGWTNILFVGRMVPNKKIEDVIRSFHEYQTRFNQRSRLLLVGSQEGFERYVGALTQLLDDLRQPNVVLTGQVSNEELTAFYDVADLFLCASEHEGFCVPLIEAFYKHVPVLAYAAAAVPSTMDGAGVLYHTKDPVHIAALMHSVLSDSSIQDAIAQGQREALQRLRAKDFGGMLLRFVEQALTLPRPAPVSVARDFRSEFERDEQIEALKIERPSAYRALATRP
ncbi:MAG TPA: glycosyltransferase [Vicinamibacterales bacterium]|nr:glycosyltransferase [Vicinamibacterales bacterium]